MNVIFKKKSTFMKDLQRKILSAIKMFSLHFRKRVVLLFIFLSYYLSLIGYQCTKIKPLGLKDLHLQSLLTGLQGGYCSVSDELNILIKHSTLA